MATDRKTEYDYNDWMCVYRVCETAKVMLLKHNNRVVIEIHAALRLCKWLQLLVSHAALKTAVVMCVKEQFLRLS